jgi:hypothetical protein
LQNLPQIQLFGNKTTSFSSQDSYKVFLRCPFSLE